MEDQLFTSERRMDIIEELRKEREKRREQIASEDIENTYEFNHAFRSETIARLAQERRNLDLVQISKDHLKDNIREEYELRGKVTNKEPSGVIEQFETYSDEIFNDDEVLQVHKRELKSKSKPKVSKADSSRNIHKDSAENEKHAKPRYLKNDKKIENLYDKYIPKSRNSETNLEKAAEKRIPETSNSYRNVKNQNPSSIETDSKREGFEKRAEELLRLKEESLKFREMEKKKKDEQELKNCSFAPQVTPYFTKAQSFEKIEDRLMKLGQEQQRKLEKLIQEKEKNESLSNFAPKISEASSLMIKNRQPIYERVEELQKEKQEVINKLRTAVEAKLESNFKPKINLNSSKISSSRYIPQDSSKDSDISRRKIRDQLEQEAVQFTFTPATSNKPVNVKAFLERQDEFLKKKEQKIQEKITMEDTCTFKPNINQNSRYISQDISEDKFERMGKQEFEKREQNKAKIQEDYYSKFSYEPKINPISKYMCRNQSHKQPKSIDVKSEQDSFSFKPKIETKNKFANVKSNYSNPGDILKNIEEKEKAKQEKLQNIKLQNEQKANKDCTFQPKIVEISENKESVLIPGLDKFLALKELSKKQEEDKKAREFKAFGIKGNTNFVTVPQPFNLAPDKKAENLNKIKQTIDQQIMKECTFKPKTLESNNLRMINQMIENLEDDED